jgi:hypothetical protein
VESSIILCPSARMREGATLVGIVMGDGTVAFAKDRLVVTPEFARNASLGVSPEKRFRFADACMKGGCRQWLGGRCSVIDEMSATVASGDRPKTLPDCSIREQCRWHRQSGPDACSVCSFVVTDTVAVVGDGKVRLPIQGARSPFV